MRDRALDWLKGPLREAAFAQPRGEEHVAPRRRLSPSLRPLPMPLGIFADGDLVLNTAG